MDSKGTSILWPVGERAISSSQGRLIGLDLLRCLAIVLVLLVHVGAELGSSVSRPFGFSGFYKVTLGGVGVTLFLIISGAVLELQYGKHSIPYRKFIARRVWRIYPVYYMTLVTGIGLFALRSHVETGGLTVFSQLSWSDALLSATGFYAFAGRWGGPL